MAFMVTVRLASDVMSETHEEYINTEKEITKFGRTNVHEDFSDFVDQVNWVSKRDTWKSKITNKLIDLNNRVRQKTLNELKTGNHSEKTKKYLRLKALYEEQLTDE